MSAAVSPLPVAKSGLVCECNVSCPVWFRKKGVPSPHVECVYVYVYNEDICSRRYSRVRSKKMKKDQKNSGGE